MFTLPDDFDPTIHKIVYTMPASTDMPEHVELVIAAPFENIKINLHNPDLTYAEYLAHVVERSIPAGALNIRVITGDQHPNDRTYRDAWTDEFATDTIDVNLAKAEEIHKDLLREARKPLLEKLDVDFMKALEIGSDTTEIVAKKQELRDITELPNTIETIDDLKAYWPEVLNEE